MAVEIRTIVEEELQQYVGAVNRGFGGDMITGELERVRDVIGLNRTHAAFDGDRIVGTIAAYSFDMAVPGAVDVKTAGLTRVTVAATHRRQGILNAMMAAHIGDAVDNDEPLSILWASEVPIYGRYGYGPSTEMLSLAFDSRLAKISRPDAPDSLDAITLDEAKAVVPALREKVRVGRPGAFSRSESWWASRNFADHEDWREGASSLRHVLATRDGEPVGYATYRHKKHWTDLDLPEGEILVLETGAVDLRAQHTLWWYLANIDLFPKVRIWNEASDCVLPWLAENSRAISRQLTDGIHLKLIDVVAALEARRYVTPRELVFALTDCPEPAPAGSYRLSVSEDGTGRCTRTDDGAAVEISAFALGSLYLGSIRPEPLAASGHITAPRLEPGAGDPDPLLQLRELFGWPVAANCDEGF